MKPPYDSFVRDRLPNAEDQPEFLFDLPELIYPERLNAAAELVDRAIAEGDGERIAIINDTGRWTYAELGALSGRIAHILANEEGLIPGNRVLLTGPNTAMLFAAWLGILKAGGVAVTIMPLLRSAEIETILKKAQINHAIVDGRVLAEVDKAVAQTSTVHSLLTYDGDAGSGPLEARLTSADPGFEAHDTASDDPALIAFTSGTTGEPKGCIHYHRDILIPADTFASHVLRPARDDIFTCSAPIAFTFGLGALLIFPLRFRATALTIEQPSPPALLDAIERHKATILFTAPTAYKAMLPQLDGRDLSTLKTCVSAGEHLPAAIWERWRDATGIAIVDGLGATEMMHIFISASGKDIRAGSTGKAVAGYTACVLDDARQPRDRGTGRLAVKGPCGCRYLDDARQHNYVQDGWNVTGDIYRIDESGYFWYVARADDMIISSGYNIAAPEVEDALLMHPNVLDCAVIGIPCEERGQKVKAFVVIQNATPSPQLAKALQDHVKAGIAPYKYPREIEFVDQLPKTATGKLQRFALKHFISGGEASQS